MELTLLLNQPARKIETQQFVDLLHQSNCQNNITSWVIDHLQQVLHQGMSSAVGSSSGSSDVSVMHSPSTIDWYIAGCIQGKPGPPWNIEWVPAISNSVVPPQ